MASGSDTQAAAAAAMPTTTASDPTPASASTMDVDPTDQPDDPAIARIEQLLRAKDDTSRFVALALLKAVLDNQDPATATASPAALLRLWDALPVKFLDKLLRAGLSSSSSSSASSSSTPLSSTPPSEHMRDLAVAVFHTFAVRVLPPEQRGDPRLTGRIPLLVASLLHAPSADAPTPAPAGDTSSSSPSASPSPQNVTTLILQTLATLVSREQGAAVFYHAVDDCSPLIELAPSQPLVLDILLSVWLYGFLAAAGKSTVNDTPTTPPSITTTLQTTLPKLVAAFKGTDGVTLLDFVARLLRGAMYISSDSSTASDSDCASASPSGLMPTAADSLVWLRPVAAFVRRLAANRPTARSRAAYTFAANALIQVFPGTAEDLLFGQNDGDDKGNDNDGSFANLFVNLLLVDVRASLPGLLSQINSRDAYASTAARLACAYDILNAFVAYLMQSMDDDDEDGDRPPTKIALSAGNLLRFRTTMAEAMSATAEYLRDRWDAAVAGAQGLHPDARSGLDPAAPATFSHALDAAGLPLIWDAADDDMIASRDPLVLAAVRTLALWLREDDNTTLRREALGLVDMLVDLYTAPVPASASASASSARSQDVRLPVIDALEGISYIDLQDGADADTGDDGTSNAAGDTAFDRKAIAVLLDHGVWKLLTDDLLAILECSGTLHGPHAHVEAYRGVRIAAFLLPIVVSESSGAPPEEWMDFVTRVAAWSGPDENTSGGDSAAVAIAVAQCRIAALQLAAQLAHGLRPAIYRRYQYSISAVRGLALQMQQSLQSLPAPLPPRLQADLDDVVDMLR